MRIVVNDTSILIDLRKAELLTSALLLPYRFQVALPLVQTELVDFTEADFADLQTRGLEVIDLAPEQVGRAITLRASSASMSINDCFSVILAEDSEDSILLTGDQTQRRNAQARGIEVHGVLWVSDELQRTELTSYSDLLDGLQRLLADPVVFLPEAEVTRRIQQLRTLLNRA